MKKHLLILMTLCVSVIGYSQTVGDTFVVDYITYEVTSVSPNEVEAHDYDHSNGPLDLVIPTSATNGGSNFNVTSIGLGAFSPDVNVLLTSVIIPDGVVQIGPEAFAYNQLTNVTIPDSVISIGYEAFYENTTITSVILGNSLEVIDESAFAFNQIGIIVFPNNSLTTILHSAFEHNQLTSVTIPNSVTVLENSVFSNNQITSAILPNGINVIESNLFFNNQLQSITIPNSVTTIDQSAFQNNQLTSIAWSNNISIIESAAFRNNQLTTINIPNSVTALGTRVFLDNPLTDVYSESTTPPTITTGANDTFSLDRSNIHLHIPGGIGVLDAYVNDAGALWTGFNPVTQDVLGVTDFELANGVTILNTTNAIKIMYSNTVRLENYTIYNMSGAKVNEGNKSEIATSSFANGIYILKLNFDKGTVTKKVVVN